MINKRKRKNHIFCRINRKSLLLLLITIRRHPVKVSDCFSFPPTHTRSEIYTAKCFLPSKCKRLALQTFLAPVRATTRAEAKV
jgi:hypothetical protein